VIMADMRKAWWRIVGSEAALGMGLLVVALAGAGLVINWLSAAAHACAPGDTAAVCHEGLKSVVVPICVFGTLAFCAVALIGLTWSSRAWTRRWAVIGLAGELACLGIGAALAATAP
jgi:hypothetical protein